MRTSHRHLEIRRVQAELERSCHPRLEMLLLVMLTGLAGCFASLFLFRAGWTTMATRYLASVTLAYVVFLILLWAWMLLRREPLADVVIDTADLLSGSARPAAADAVADAAAAGDVGVGDALAAADAEAVPLALVIGLIVAGVAIVLTLFSVVTTAPLLFAELIVDGVLSASLYQRLYGIDRHHWLESALRRTLKPFLLTAAIACVTGLALAMYAPGAHSIGQAITMRRSG